MCPLTSLPQHKLPLSAEDGAVGVEAIVEVGAEEAAAEPSIIQVIRQIKTKTKIILKTLTNLTRGVISIRIFQQKLRGPVLSTGGKVAELHTAVTLLSVNGSTLWHQGLQTPPHE